MKSKTFQQCLRALQNDDLEAVDRLLKSVPMSGPAEIALATEIKSQMNRRKRAFAGGTDDAQRLAERVDPIVREASNEAYMESMAPSGRALFRDNYTSDSVDVSMVNPMRQRDFEFLISQRDIAVPLPGVSLVAGCMNREENLLKVLGSWLATGADEIVIVDWSSTSELWPKLARIGDQRIKVIRIDNEKQWIAAHALNVGLRFASHELVFRVDCDIQLSPDFLELNSPQPGELVRGFWKSGLEHGGDGQQFIQGTFGAYKKDLREANYYDERILTYGWEDSELYLRLTHDFGVAAKQIDPRTLRHVEQTEQQRLENQNVSKNRFLGKFEPTEFEGAKNKFYSAFAGSWGTYFPSQDYGIFKIEERFFRGSRVTRSLKRNAELERLSEALAARQLTVWALSTMPEIGDVDQIGPEFAGLLRDVHFANKSGHLIDGIRSGTGIYFVRCESEGSRAALHKTLDVMRSHYPSFARSLFLVENSSEHPTKWGEDNRLENVFTTSAELLEKLSIQARAKKIQNVGGLEKLLESGDPNAGYLEISVRSLVKEAIWKATQFSTNLAGEYESLAEPVPGSCFVTSLYDEQNLIRLSEYLACVVENLRVFERIVIYYEASNGLLAAVLQKISEEVSLLPGRLLLLPYQKRPTFEELFSVKAFLAAGTIIAVANADVVFDASFSKITQVDLTRNIVVLSRRDISRSGKKASLIRIENGIPNTFSQDAWIFSSPFDPDFFLDYPIGTMHCDSFINHQISRSSRYNVINPCLDIKVFHLHDDRFNSSAEKQKRDYAVIKKSYDFERERNGGADPVKGVAWSTLKTAAIVPSAIQFQHWAPKVIVLNFDKCSEPSFGHFLLLHLLSGAVQVIKDVTFLIRLRKSDLEGPLAILLARYQTHFYRRSFLIEIDDEEFDETKPSAAGTVTRAISFEKVSEWIIKGSINYLNNNTCELLAWPSTKGTKFLRCEVSGDMTTESTQTLFQTLLQRENVSISPLFEFYTGLPDYSAEKNLIAPFVIPSLGATSMNTVNRVKDSSYPSVSFVTSLFKGGTFLPGYLENVLAAAKEANGEVIIIDANVEDDDGRVVKAFLESHSAARDYIDYIRLDHDPGLYECWRIGIERARADLITNANIDDRRCPYHTARLVQLLRENPEYAGACGSIACVRSDGTGGWFSLYENQIWFLGEQINEIGFEDLYRVNERGEISSRDVMHCMPVWRRSLHHRYGYFDEVSYGTSADWALWLKCSKAGEKFIFDEGAFGRYFLNPESHNRRNDPDGHKERRIIKDFIGVDQLNFSKQ